MGLFQREHCAFFVLLVNVLVFISFIFLYFSTRPCLFLWIYLWLSGFVWFFVFVYLSARPCAGQLATQRIDPCRFASQVSLATLLVLVQLLVFGFAFLYSVIVFLAASGALYLCTGGCMLYDLNELEHKLQELSIISRKSDWLFGQPLTSLCTTSNFLI